MGLADIRSYLDCVAGIAAERRFLLYQAAPEIEMAAAWLLRQTEKDAPTFVATLNKSVIGWCAITAHDEPWFKHRGSLGMGVTKEFRGGGVGARLLGSALRAAKGQGLERIELEVFASNVPAITLYQKYGFEVEGRLRAAKKTRECSDDILLMNLNLGVRPATAS